MRAGIALGSNLGDRAENLRQAQRAILEIAGVDAAAPTRVAPALETEPVGCPPSAPPFLNTVMEIECSLAPEDLLGELRAIEAALGRPPVRPRNASRAIDLDLLYVDDQRRNTPELTLPHPRIVQRRFVLEPLAAIRPELVLPGQQKSVAELLDSLESGPRS